MLLAVAVVASVLGVYRIFWNPAHPNHQMLLGAYILLTCVAVIASIPPRSRLRGAFLGASLFGSFYFVFVLKCGFGLETIHDSKSLANNTVIGFALFGVSFLASQLCVLLVWPREESGSRRIG
jgi:hypothetical protein